MDKRAAVAQMIYGKLHKITKDIYYSKDDEKNPYKYTLVNIETGGSMECYWLDIIKKNNYAIIIYNKDYMLYHNIVKIDTNKSVICFKTNYRYMLTDVYNLNNGIIVWMHNTRDYNTAIIIRNDNSEIIESVEKIYENEHGYTIIQYKNDKFESFNVDK